LGTCYCFRLGQKMLSLKRQHVTFSLTNGRRFRTAQTLVMQDAVLRQQLAKTQRARTACRCPRMCALGNRRTPATRCYLSPLSYLGDEWAAVTKKRKRKPAVTDRKIWRGHNCTCHHLRLNSILLYSLTHSKLL
jgi:hypothetical protein